MPNWCNNTLELAHADPAMLERARDALNRGEFLEEFIPVPQELKIVAGRVGDAADPKQIELEAQEARNRELFGYATWYDFCVNEWGTKWDVGGDGVTTEIENGGITTSFDSAWSPPIQAYEKLVELGFSVRAYYCEPGMAYAGIWEDGVDDFYEYGGMNSEQVAEELPSALDEMFCISESMAEWEADNAELEEELDANTPKDI